MEYWKIWKEWYTPWNAKNPTYHCIEVSNYGQVRKDGKIQTLYSDGRYLRFGWTLVHRMVAELFIPNPDNKPCVDHIDTNKRNNNVNNLRWVTYSENMLNPKTSKLNSAIQKKCQIGEKNGMYGKHHTDESKKLIANSKLNRKCVNNGIIEKYVPENELEIYLNSNFKLGRLKFSDEHKKRISEARKKIKGWHHSDETKRKISESNKNKHNKRTI